MIGLAFVFSMFPRITLTGTRKEKETKVKKKKKRITVHN